MNLKSKLNLPVNAFIRTPGKISELHQNLSDINDALETNAAVIKHEVEKQRRLIELKNETLMELGGISKDLLDTENGNELKKSTLVTSSQVMSEGKNFITTTASRKIRHIQSLKQFLKRKQSFSDKDVELLRQLAELKKQGIISENEFSETKKKILSKL